MGVLERFEAKYIPEPNSGCWIWMAALRPNGYSQFGVGPRHDHKNWLAHRWAYENFIGPIPENLTLDHLCRLRCCVNPWHCEPVTGAENTRRGDAGKWGKSKTHCPHGHPYSVENTYIHPTSKARVCIECLRASKRRYREKRRAAS